MNNSSNSLVNSNWLETYFIGKSLLISPLWIFSLSKKYLAIFFLDRLNADSIQFIPFFCSQISRPLQKRVPTRRHRPGANTRSPLRPFPRNPCILRLRQKTRTMKKIARITSNNRMENCCCRQLLQQQKMQETAAKNNDNKKWWQFLRLPPFWPQHPLPPSWNPAPRPAGNPPPGQQQPTHQPRPWKRCAACRRNTTPTEGLSSALPRSLSTRPGEPSECLLAGIPKRVLFQT